MDKNIEHIGKIQEVRNDTLVVSVDSSACESCSLNTHCKPQKGNGDSIVINTLEADAFVVGENVRVIVTAKMQKHAIFFGTVLPTLTIVLAIIVATYYGCSQLLSAMVGIIMLGLYYFILYLKRERLKNKFNFTVKKLKY